MKKPTKFNADDPATWSRKYLVSACIRQRDVMIDAAERRDEAEKQTRDLRALEEQRNTDRHHARSVLQNKQVPKAIRDAAANWLISE